MGVNPENLWKEQVKQVELALKHIPTNPERYKMPIRRGVKLQNIRTNGDLNITVGSKGRQTQIQLGSGPWKYSSECSVCGGTTKSDRPNPKCPICDKRNLPKNYHYSNSSYNTQKQKIYSTRTSLEDKIKICIAVIMIIASILGLGYIAMSKPEPPKENVTTESWNEDW